jgi:uncharacterized protein YndB with AHSA1/START domain
MNDGILDGDSVRFERLVPGPIERVWSYLTEGPLLKAWLVEDGAVPPRVGESFVLKMGGGDDSWRSTGRHGTPVGEEHPLGTKLIKRARGRALTRWLSEHHA